LLHCPDQLFSPDGKDIYQSLIRLKKMGYVKKIGVSVYSPDELDKIFQEMQFDIVQAPLSILDRRLINSGWVARLSQANVEIHVRSIFLQGLLLMSIERRPKKFDRWQSVWSEWNSWLSENNLTPLEACLGYALSIDEVDKVVVGVDSVSHLSEILSLVSRKKISLPNWPESIDMDLLNPAKWGAL
jgi:aryl-alcohol dehydrogenase-like predicted oxidoreductase